MKQLGLALGDRKYRHDHPEAPEPSLTGTHLTQAQFTCTTCGCEFATAAGLHQHLSLQHPHTQKPGPSTWLEMWDLWTPFLEFHLPTSSPGK